MPLLLIQKHRYCLHKNSKSSINLLKRVRVAYFIECPLDAPTNMLDVILKISLVNHNIDRKLTHDTGYRLNMTCFHSLWKYHIYAT